MDIKQIIEKYLEPLQSLQATVANSGNANVAMEVRVKPDDYILADITLYDKDGNTEKYIHKYFADWYGERSLDRHLIELNAFFAECCLTTATGVESPICLN